MTICSPELGRKLRNMEKHFAGQVEQREEKAIAAHIAAVNASLGKPSRRRPVRAEPMPYRSRIIFAFALLASALAGLSWWCP